MQYIVPAQPELCTLPPVGDSWVHEIKFDVLPHLAAQFSKLHRALVPSFGTSLKLPSRLSKISLGPQGPRGFFVGRVSVYTEILSISSRARSCRSFGIVSMGNVEAVCGTRHVLRTIVESSSRSVWKLCTGVPSSSCFEIAFSSAAAERRAGATGSRVALAA